MNKATIIWLALFLGLSCPALAKAGVADGGFELMMAVIGVILLFAGLFAGLEYLIKDSGSFLHRLRRLMKKNRVVHRNSD